MLMASWAAADITVTNGDPSQDITIELTICCVVNVWWAPVGDGYSWDLNDQSIVFNDIVQDGGNEGDWYSDVLTGAYGAATNASTSPWGNGYYESYDAALFWLETNCNATMALTSAGDLDNGDGGTLPTWYTIAFTNNLDCSGTDCGFINGGVRCHDGQIPFDGYGSYGDDANADNHIEICGGAFYPNQFSFPMEDGGSPSVYTADFEGFAQGTVLFHGRVLRSGLADPTGHYQTTLNVSFTTP